MISYTIATTWLLQRVGHEVTHPTWLKFFMELCKMKYLLIICAIFFQRMPTQKYLFAKIKKIKLMLKIFLVNIKLLRK